MKKNSIVNIIKTLNLTLVFLFLIITLFQIGIFSKKLYFITEAERKIKQLSKENQMLQEQFLNSNSLSNLDDFIKRENFVKIGKMKFIQVFEGAVLAK